MGPPLPAKPFRHLHQLFQKGFLAILKNIAWLPPVAITAR